MRKGWREWLLGELASRGISQWHLKMHAHFSPQTFDNWEKTGRGYSGSVRKLAGILEIPYGKLLDRIGLKIAVPVPPKRA